MNNFESHILVVDDDDGIRDLVKKYLNENNFLVTTAKNAEDAYKKTNIIKFDLIILDIMMPGQTGLQFLSENKKKFKPQLYYLQLKESQKKGLRVWRKEQMIICQNHLNLRS